MRDSSVAERTFPKRKWGLALPPAPTVPVSTAKPWVKARRLLWGSRLPAQAEALAVTRSGFSPARRCSRSPASARPRPGSGRGFVGPGRFRSRALIEANFAEASFGRSHQSEALLGTRPKVVRQSKLCRASGSGVSPGFPPMASLSESFGRASPASISPKPSKRPSTRPARIFRVRLAASASDPFAVPWAEALVPPDRSCGKWVRLPPRASSLELARFRFRSRFHSCEFRLLFSRLCLGASFRLRSVAPRHVLKLT